MMRFSSAESPILRVVAVLFARIDSVYKGLEGVEVYDKNRDARTFLGGMPVVAHPPCRSWGRLRHFACAPDGEHELAIWAVEQVRKWGGVLEHPADSLLWKKCGLPTPGKRDAVGGWTLAAPQFWWGHRANKASRFYICGVEPCAIPKIPLKLGEATHVIKSNKHGRKLTTKAERESSPPALAYWLVNLARRVGT